MNNLLAFTTLLRIGLAVLGLGCAALLGAVYFGYFYKPYPDSTRCDEIPDGSVVFVLAFEHMGDNGALIDPGNANIFLAQRLAECADRLSIIYTQKAVSDAMIMAGLSSDGHSLGKVPVRQMHFHDPKVPFRTLQALGLGLNQIQPLPDQLVLLAHDKQIDRAVLDLRCLYPGKIVIWKVPGAPYQDDKRYRPLIWALRELYLAGPVEAIQRLLGRPASPPVIHACTNCEHYRAGDLDARVNWMNCAQGHCLIDKAEKTIVHVTEEGETMLVTRYGWTGGDGFGDPMLDRTDCPDWKKQGFRLEFHSMEY